MNSSAIQDQVQQASGIVHAHGNETKKRSGRAALKYRPDIDGLRAVAVLSVLAFHAEISKLSGGYVGVDVFFVISGYLISSIVFDEIAASRFSVIGFYERRIRRIFPALFAMLAVCGIFAGMYLLPSELVNYAKSALAATTSASNFYFWKHSGYFDLPTSQPLLHTWSLAVEEQFYILFPLFLVLVRKFFPQRLKIAVVALFFASFIASALMISRSEQTVFYMPYTRAWELLLGTILSLGMLPRIQSIWLRNLATLAGIGMIGLSVLRYTQDTPFPGPTALLPCVGSALIIWAGEAGSSLVGAILSWRPIVFIGLISYSLYLWHWPVIVLRHLGVLIGVGAVASRSHIAMFSSHRFDILIESLLSFALAVLSWRFVERPFRNGRFRLSGRPLFALAGVFIAALIGTSSWAILAGGFPARFPPNALKVASALDGNGEFAAMRTGVCFLTTEDNFNKFDSKDCLREDSQRKNYLLLGDSHSAMLWSALSSSLKNINLMQASTAACEPSLHPASFPNCNQMMAFIFQSYLPTHPVQGMYVVGRWEGKDMAALGGVVTWAKQHQIPVTVFGPVPEYDAPLPRLLAYSIAWTRPNFASQHAVPTMASLDSEMKRLSTDTWHAHYISLYRTICSDDGCTEFADAAHTIPLMNDTDHLNQFGASLVVQRLVERGELP
jgi:peptidoglycan/LPS O-acetylase OafA/YrhL